MIPDGWSENAEFFSMAPGTHQASEMMCLKPRIFMKGMDLDDGLDLASL